MQKIVLFLFFTIFLYAGSFENGLEFYHKKEFFKAKKEFLKAVSTNKRASFYIAQMYKFGNLGSIDYGMAQKYYMIAARKGDLPSQFVVGLHYLKGRGVLANSSKVVYWFKKSAKAGNMKATYMLGFLYEYGIGVKKNLDKSYRWYKKAKL